VEYQTEQQWQQQERELEQQSIARYDAEMRDALEIEDIAYGWASAMGLREAA
jgi:hypothetical protein